MTGDLLCAMGLPKTAKYCMKSILTWITTKLPMRNSRKMNHNQSVYQLIGEINGTRELANSLVPLISPIN